MKGKSPLTEIIFDFLQYAHESAECGLYLDYLGLSDQELVNFIDRFLDKRWESEQ